MKKAVVIGGSNGIGLAISKELNKRGYLIEILDRSEPDISDNGLTTYDYTKCNLLDFNESLFSNLAEDKNVQLVMITAGFGRVADFQYLHPAEIHNLMTVNAESGIKIVRYFYQRLLSSKDFYFGMMGSIAGLISSPMFAVYSASKAAVCKFIEAVNIELEVSGSPNRILNVSPGSIKGTKFNGGKNDPALTENLAQQIVDHMITRDTLYIPDYEETYKGVIARYNSDPHAFGLTSYQYKKQSGRVFNESKVCIGYLSGTFDLFHIGHLNLLRRAKEQCDYLIVGVHASGSWKGKETFVPLEERKAIVAACKYVDRVVDAPDEDDEAWKAYHYNKLFVGSDYKGTERFNRYEEEFKDKEVKIIYFPYTKTTSSSELRQAIHKKIDE